MQSLTADFCAQRVLTGTREMDEISTFRYRVFCQNKHLIDATAFCATQRESDLFDDSALHFNCRRRSTGEMVGVVRLIVDGPRGFPLERRYPLFAPIKRGQGQRRAEISRLAVVPRKQDAASLPGGVCPITLELYRCMFQYSLAYGLTHWLAAMEPALARLLARLGFLFVPIGEAVDYKPVKVPYLASIKNIERNVCHRSPDVYFGYFLGPMSTRGAASRGTHLLLRCDSRRTAVEKAIF